jgi:hypothetical protein
MNLSKDFTLDDFLSPDVRIMTDEARINIEKLVVAILQPLRDYMGTPIRINSGFRTKAYNKKVGGVPSSDHLMGFAADIDTTDNKKAFDFIKANCKFKQLINEKKLSWIHVSYDENNLKCQVLAL